MPRPLCLFTGQWADLPLETLAAQARAFGYDGLELACWGDHFDVQRALREPDYCAFEIPDEFVVGYGLDYNDHYRNLPFIAALEPHEIAAGKSS